MQLHLTQQRVESTTCKANSSINTNDHHEHFPKNVPSFRVYSPLMRRYHCLQTRAAVLCSWYGERKERMYSSTSSGSSTMALWLLGSSRLILCPFCSSVLTPTFMPTLGSPDPTPPSSVSMATKQPSSLSEERDILPDKMKQIGILLQLLKSILNCFRSDRDNITIWIRSIINTIWIRPKIWGKPQTNIY